MLGKENIMRWFWSCALLCCVCVTSGFSQLKTGNEYVTAIVDPNNQGLITIRRAPGTNLDPILSYPQKSFVSIMVGDKIFTNNHTGQNVSNDPRFGGFLDNGVTQRFGDTLRTTWPDKNGCDIIQDVYAVKLEFSGQIVMRWKIKNNSTTKAIWGQAQLLLDIQVGNQNPNDGAPILTQYGYRPIWEKYTSASASGIPWFFAAFENQLPNPPIFNTGVTGVGYNQDVNYKLGLKKPSQMTVGDWGNPLGTAALVDFLWGVSAAAPWGTSFNDAAIHFQWDGLAIPGGKALEVASTSYGTGEFGICTGQLFGVVFYPRHFRWSPYKYTPDTANVEFYAFDVYSPIPQDPNFGPPSLSTSIKLHCGPNLRIIEPGTGKTHDQQTQPADIQQYQVGRTTWKVVVDKYTNCKGNLESWLKFSAQSSLSGTGPIFFNSGDGDTCEHALTIDCSVLDTLAPALSTIDSSFIGRYRKTLTAFERRPIDRRIKTVTITRAAGTDSTFSFITVSPKSFTLCILDSILVALEQSDSTNGGCLNVTITDCAENDTTVKICFATHAPIDVNPPILFLDSTTRPYLRVSIRDTIQHDLGIDSVWFVPDLQTDTSQFSIGKGTSDGECPESLYYEITQLDAKVGGCFTVYALDCAGNLTTSKLYCFPMTPGSVGEKEADLIDLIGNPASDRTTLRINVSAAYAATIRVVDLTGREVAIQQARLLAGRNDLIIGTSGLAQGIYYVIADWDGRSYAKKLTVIK